MVYLIYIVKKPAANGSAIGPEEEKEKLRETEKVNGDIDIVEQPPTLRGLTFMVEKVRIGH